MANISITLEGIRKAAASLNYGAGTAKQKTLAAIQSFYTSEDTVHALHHIDTDILVKAIWDVGENNAKILAKRRNFSSLRSAINADLKRLSRKDKNPENIIITDANIFDMTEDAKNNLLSSFSDAIKTGDIDLQQATGILKALTDFLDEFQMDGNTEESLDIIEQIKNLLKRISHDIPAEDDTQAQDGDGGEGGEEDTEEIILDEDEVLEEVGELDEDAEIEEIEALDDDDQITESDEELVELEADQDFEETASDASDEDTAHREDEEIADVEILDEDDTITEVDEDEELAALAPDEELVELDEEETLDEDIDEIVLDEDEELEEVDELTDEELQALEDFREKQAMAEEFDDTLGEREKKFNAYVKVPKGIYTVGTKKERTAMLELQQFAMPEVHIARYPVTNALFEIFIDKTGYQTTAEKCGFGTVFFSRYKRKGNQASWHKSAGSRQVNGACWYQPHGPGSSLHEKRNHPVVQVSVKDAFAYASWIGRRLPTQAEWEAAARTDLGYRYPWGNDFATRALNIEASGQADTCPVDAYELHANAFTIVDMLGNVMEWTSDVEKLSVTNISDQFFCIAKGAAWNSSSEVSISSRGLFKNGCTANTIGFRCISELAL